MKQFMPVTQHFRDGIGHEIMSIEATDIMNGWHTPGSIFWVNKDTFPGVYPPSSACVIESTGRIGHGCMILVDPDHLVNNETKLCMFIAISWNGEVVPIGSVALLSVGGIVSNEGPVGLMDDIPDVYKGLILKISGTAASNNDDVKKCMEDFVYNVMGRCLHVLSFLGCKNITAEPVETMQNVRVPRKNPNKFRVEQRPFRYHVLKISSPGASKQSHATGAERLTAAHICRGHVKRYTAEKPLLGRHVGAFYFAQHVRGSEAVGVVEKDYKVVTR